MNVPAMRCVLPSCDASGAAPKLRIKNASPAMARHPLVLYADFESVLSSIAPPKEWQKSIDVSLHEPLSIRCHIVSTIELPPELQDWQYTASSVCDAHHAFVLWLLEIEGDLLRLAFPFVPMEILNASQQQEFDMAETCCFCDKSFDEPMQHPGNAAFIEFLETDPKYAETLQKVRKVTSIEHGGLIGDAPKKKNRRCNPERH